MKKDAPFLALLIVLAIVATWPLGLHLGDHFPNDAYDPAYCVWAMNWTVQALTGNPAALADGNIFYPHKGTLFYADAVIGLALLGAPFALLTGNPVFAHNLLLILAFVISGWGMYFLARRLTGRREAAFLAALVFAYFPYHFSHIMHLELLSYGWIPFCLLFLHRFFDEPSWKNVLGTGVFFILQVTCCAYYAEYLAMCAGFLFLYLFFREGRFRKGVYWGRAAGLAALIGIVLAPYLFGYFSVHERMLFERPIWEVRQFSPELQNIVIPPDWNRLWGWFAGRPAEMEKMVYPGLGPLLLTGVWWTMILRKSRARRKEGNGVSRKKRQRIVWDVFNLVLLLAVLAIGVTGGFETSVAGIRLSVRSLANPVAFLALSVMGRIFTDREKRKRWMEFGRALTPPQRFYSVLAVLSLLLAMGPVLRLFGREIIPGPYAFFYEWVPGFKGLRVPGRFIVLAVLGLAVLMAYAAAGISAKIKSARGRIGLAAGIALVLALDYSHGPIPLVPTETAETLAPIYSEVKKLPAEAVLLELPLPAKDAEEYEDALPTYRSIFHGRRLVNGYSGYAPPAYRIVREAMERFPDRRSFDLLENLEVGYVLVHANGYRADKGGETAERLKIFPRRALLIGKKDGDLLYRLLPYRKVHEAETPIAPIPPRIIGDRSIWKARARLNPQTVGAAFDGDPQTAWSTGYPQSEGDDFVLDLGRTEHFRRLDLMLGRNPLDYPRSFVVEVSIDGEVWREVERDPAYFPDLKVDMVEDFSKYSVPAIFETAEARFVRIRLTGGHESRHWSIAEIILRGDESSPVVRP